MWLHGLPDITCVFYSTLYVMASNFNAFYILRKRTLAAIVCHCAKAHRSSTITATVLRHWISHKGKKYTPISKYSWNGFHFYKAGIDQMSNSIINTQYHQIRFFL